MSLGIPQLPEDDQGGTTGGHWRWPALRLKPALGLLGIHVLVGLWLGSMAVLTARMEGRHLSWGMASFREVTGALGVFAVFPVPLTVLVNASRPGGRWIRFLAIHLLGAGLFVCLAPALFMLVRSFCWPLLGWGTYSPGPIWLLLPWELQRMAFVYALILGVMSFYNYLAARRYQVARESRLLAQLQEARLQSLSAQLDPHFLFNALNTISSMMYEDLEGSDRLFSSLGQMLRDNLEEGGASWPLRRELNNLESFMDFVRTRFGDRLRIILQVEEGFGSRSVPRFALQRLVENSLKHNQDRTRGTLSIWISVVAQDGGLLVKVEDDGRGFRHPGLGLEEGGLGLRNLRTTLELLHGPESRLECRNRLEGGASVAFRIPLEEWHG